MEKKGSGLGTCFPSKFLLSLLVFSSFLCTPECAKSPAMFIFGDSLIDNGNNNFLPSLAKANYAPYGIDFGQPSGRFCNGLTVADFGSKHLGLPYPPPYLSLASRTSKILDGVNYASAAAGILEDTGINYGARVTFTGQLNLFEKTVRKDLPNLIPNAAALARFLESSLFIVNIGSNDYINNYLLPKLYATSRIYSGDAFADLLITNLSQQLMRLYSIGARKIVVVGLGPLGCIPSQLNQHNSTDGRCIERVNKVVSAFNQRLLPLTVKLNNSLPGSFFVYQNIYVSFYDLIQNSSKYGFSVNNQACCGNGMYGGEVSCLPLQRPCNTRDQFVFWDSFHPTQAANAIMAARSYGPEAGDCYPISIYELAQI
ncbi:uncharacterized protein A4U43_C01F5730 [Asparagus officinalis]|uniref:Uncharacterized protein n=1 Tax=Asparagus officinalis TaxID=4686 RepID=A0A5P1FM36_ASPOF|nr:GDSL esterase/lipase 7-like [Asparagus officinalis]ONK79376.1 uncharacterized protein A4U43_C01F5730 [Asparagus officinalis]